MYLEEDSHLPHHNISSLRLDEIRTKSYGAKTTMLAILALNVSVFLCRGYILMVICYIIVELLQ